MGEIYPHFLLSLSLPSFYISPPFFFHLLSTSLILFLFFSLLFSLFPLISSSHLAPYNFSLPFHSSFPLIFLHFLSFSHTFSIIFLSHFPSFFQFLPPLYCSYIFNITLFSPLFYPLLFPSLPFSFFFYSFLPLFYTSHTLFLPFPLTFLYSPLFPLLYTLLTSSTTFPSPFFSSFLSSPSLYLSYSVTFSPLSSLSSPSLYLPYIYSITSPFPLSSFLLSALLSSSHFFHYHFSLPAFFHFSPTLFLNTPVFNLWCIKILNQLFTCVSTCATYRWDTK